MTTASEGTTMDHDDHEAMLKVLREVVREENGLKRWAAGVAVTVAAAAILGSFVVWRTQAVIVVRLDRVEIDVGEIRSDVREIRDKVVSGR